MSLPDLSVLVPSRNHERFIEACLDSAAARGGPGVEILVLDDGSTDSTLERARAWGRGRPNFEAQGQAQAGVCATLNRLVARARGRFVSPLASDDLVLPGGLETRAAALDADPDLLGVFGDCSVIDGDGRLLHASGLRDLHGADLDALRSGRLRARELVMRWCIPGPVSMFRREAYDPVRGVGPYDESLVVEDRDFYLRLVARGALGFVDATVAAYRVHGGNLGRDPKVRARFSEDLGRSARKNLPRFSGLQQVALSLEADFYRAMSFRHRGLRPRLWDRIASSFLLPWLRSRLLSRVGRVDPPARRRG